MSRVNSVKIVEENTSESGSDGVDVYVDPVRGQENNNEEEVKVNADGGNEDDNIKQRYKAFTQGKYNEKWHKCLPGRHFI